ncbi:MAG: hypothetical protein U1E43_04545 [Rhodospirillales bacterium]
MPCRAPSASASASSPSQPAAARPPGWRRRLAFRPRLGLRLERLTEDGADIDAADRSALLGEVAAALQQPRGFQRGADDAGDVDAEAGKAAGRRRLVAARFLPAAGAGGPPAERAMNCARSGARAFSAAGFAVSALAACAAAAG